MKRNPWFTFVALLVNSVLLLACAETPAELAKTAADRWYVACGIRPTPRYVVVLPNAVRVECAGHDAAVGCYDRQHDRVTVAGRATVPVGALLLHEFGHVLGAGHLETGQQGVMTAQVGSASWRACLTDDDLDAVGWCTVNRPECP